MASPSITIGRDRLSLSALVISNPFESDFWIPEDGLFEPEFAQRDSLADESAFTPGMLPTHSVTDEGTLQSEVYVKGANELVLQANKRALEAAVRQFRFPVTVEAVGAPDTYNARAGRLSWGAFDSGMGSALMARAAVTIPVQPLGA